MLKFEVFIRLSIDTLIEKKYYSISLKSLSHSWSTMSYDMSFFVPTNMALLTLSAVTPFIKWLQTVKDVTEFMKQFYQSVIFLFIYICLYISWFPR